MALLPTYQAESFSSDLIIARLVEWYNSQSAEQRTVATDELLLIKVKVLLTSDGIPLFVIGNDPTSLNDPTRQYIGEATYMWVGTRGVPITATSSDFLEISKFTPPTITTKTVTATWVHAKPPLYTIFGDASDNWPQLSSTGNGSDYVRTYIAGVFDVKADLTDLSLADCRVAMIFHGSLENGTAQLVLNGTVVKTRSTMGVKSIGGYWETSYGTDDPLNLQYTGFLLNMGFNGDVSVNSPFNIAASESNPYISFDTKDVKFAWYVDQHTGEAPGQRSPSNAIGASPMMMYTNPNPKQPFVWADYLEPAVPGDEPCQMFDVQTKTTLNVNLGGSERSWTAVAQYSNSGHQPSYNMGYPITPPNESIVVDGGFQYPTGINNWVGSGTFNINAYKSSYCLPDQTIFNPVMYGGIRSYPNIASSMAFHNAPYIQALNFGEPVLFECWYSVTE